MANIGHFDLQKNFGIKHEEHGEGFSQSRNSLHGQYILRQPESGDGWRLRIEREIKALDKKIKNLMQLNPGIIKIQILPKYNLKNAIDAIVEPDDTGFIARTIDLPLYAHSKDSIDAVDALKDEIESLYEDLIEDDDFTPEWLKIKSFLTKCIGND